VVDQPLAAHGHTQAPPGCTKASRGMDVQLTRSNLNEYFFDDSSTIEEPTFSPLISIVTDNHQAGTNTLQDRPPRSDFVIDCTIFVRCRPPSSPSFPRTTRIRGNDSEPTRTMGNNQNLETRGGFRSFGIRMQSPHSVNEVHVGRLRYRNQLPPTWD
jgi:hypothetical protein